MNTVKVTENDKEIGTAQIYEAVNGVNGVLSWDAQITLNSDVKTENVEISSYPGVEISSYPYGVGHIIIKNGEYLAVPR